MKKEKIVKQQARQALQGNITPIIAGFTALILAFILLENLFYWLTVLFGAIDFDTERVTEGKELIYFAVLAGTVTLGVLFSPFVNGVFKAASNTAVKKHCDVADVFYFFGSLKRFLKTIVINMSLLLVYGALTWGIDCLYGMVAENFDNQDFGWLVVAAATAVVVVWKILIYLLFIHYPLCIYAVDDSKSAGKYIFGYIGFSFRHFGAALKLFFSFIGWLALCFFVVPMLYVVPYALVSAMNSTRWLLALER